ncbi:DUF2231 domain-containing protein [Rubrivirga sp. S365]|uniref:DUF2231 domain-containing protein n=1 Tax=Rubrivirga sp. S365 TaxID=3076080 RepID=UPI0028C9C2CC|nr:DUF2231 domain-containing protein [Rubrivirga sp. S365]MDT7856419.1 DUF2231 domain-containing protein [Rubrivirga sp. S365]
MPVADYEIPFLHPLLVHFPLVLVLLGGAAAGLYLLLGRGVWRRAALALFVLGASSAWAAAETGHALYDAVEGDPVVEAIVGHHQSAAAWTVWTSALAAAVFAALSVAAVLRRAPAPPDDEAAPPRRRWWPERGGDRQARRPRREPLWGRVLGALPAVVAAALVAYTAHLGGLMVWGVPR